MSSLLPSIGPLAALLLCACVSPQVRQARGLYETGLKQRDPAQRVARFARARDLLRGVSAQAPGRVDSLRAANALALGNAHRAAGAPLQARRAYEEGLTSARRLRSPMLLAALLHNMGSLRLARKQPRPALVLFEQAREAATRAEARRLLAQVFNGLGSCALELARWRRAQRHFETARAMAREVGSDRERLLAAGGLARLSALQGDAAAARQLFRRAIAEADRRGLLRTAASLRVNAAAWALRRGAVRRALVLLDTASDSAERVKDRTLRAALLHNLGGVYLTAHMFGAALSSYRRALQAAHDAAIVLSMATAQYASGELERAEQSLARLEPGELDSNQRRQKAWLQAWIAHARGRHQRATVYVEQVCGQGAVGRRQAADCALARATLAQGRKRVLALGQKSLQAYGELGDVRGQINSLLIIARARRERHDNEGALRAYRRAADLVERRRPQMGSDLLKLSYGASKQRLYEQALALLTAKLPVGAPPERLTGEVLQYLERSRGRGLRDLMQEGRLGGLFMKPGLQRLSARRLRAVQRLQRLLGRAKTPADVRRLSGRLARAVRRFDAVRLRAMEGAPAAVRRTIYTPLVTLPTLQQQAREHGVALMSYHLSERLGLALMVTAEATRIRRLAQPRSVMRRVDLLLRLIKGRQQGPGVRAALITLARGLYRELLGPEQALIGQRTLVISAHGPLLRLPFQVLLAGEVSQEQGGTGWADLPFLVHRQPVAYAPSLSVWSALQERGDSGSRALSHAMAVGRFLGLADPRWKARVAAPTSLPADWSTQRGLRRLRLLLRGSTLPPLPQSRQELRDVARAFAADRRTTLLGAAATEGALKGRLQRERYQFLHIAAHGFADEDQASFSSVVLAPDAGEDGLLELVEIYGLDLRQLELTVLSACQTAIGRAVAGEGVVNLVRGFLGAGSRRVVASLWHVADESTRLLMARFYRGLARGLAPARALEQAQRALARGELGARFAGPFHWAPFTLYGAAGAGGRP